MSARAGLSDDGYGASRTLFEAVVAFLDGDEAAGTEHAELEDQLQERSRQLFAAYSRITSTVGPSESSGWRR